MKKKKKLPTSKPAPKKKVFAMPPGNILEGLGLTIEQLHGLLMRAGPSKGYRLFYKGEYLGEIELEGLK
jgi:hypothetical protein